MTSLAALEWWKVTPGDALWAGEHRATQRRKGYTVSLWDALIAAAAVRQSAAILTSNLRDFRVAGIEVMRMEDYPP